MFINELVSNDESKVVKELHPENIPDISRILPVLKLLNLIVLKPVQPENMNFDELTSNDSNTNPFIDDIYSAFLSVKEKKNSSKFVTLYLKYILTVVLAGIVKFSSGFIIL